MGHETSESCQIWVFYDFLRSWSSTDKTSSNLSLTVYKRFFVSDKLKTCWLVELFAKHLWIPGVHLAAAEVLMKHGGLGRNLSPQKPEWTFWSKKCDSYNVFLPNTCVEPWCFLSGANLPWKRIHFKVAGAAVPPLGPLYLAGWVEPWCCSWIWGPTVLEPKDGWTNSIRAVVLLPHAKIFSIEVWTSHQGSPENAFKYHKLLTDCILKKLLKPTPFPEHECGSTDWSWSSHWSMSIASSTLSSTRRMCIGWCATEQQVGCNQKSLATFRLWLVKAAVSIHFCHPFKQRSVGAPD